MHINEKQDVTGGKSVNSNFPVTCKNIIKCLICSYAQVLELCITMQFFEIQTPCILIFGPATPQKRKQLFFCSTSIIHILDWKLYLFLTSQM
jgi:hypothetical protein